ncbi:MAG: 30S ribosomal protein S6 [Fibromonadaceae bacterium]|jgi:small subunit ribosomal protein S6|nr:30S ribosomal protein S6 [Fibromonadaceae bacterium]
MDIRDYETMVVIDAMISDEAIDAEMLSVERKIAAHSGEIKRCDKWGKRKLAYPIRKQTYGFYVIFYYKANSDIVSDLERSFNINSNILRFLTLVDYPLTEVIYNQDHVSSAEDTISFDLDDGDTD